MHNRWSLMAHAELLQESMDAAPGPRFEFGPDEFMPSRTLVIPPHLTEVDGHGSTFYGTLLAGPVAEYIDADY